MLRQPVITKDGSHTLAIPDWKVTYHSLHGAISESRHVYINAGLRTVLSSHHEAPLRVFEMGFGTGLNALLTLAETAELSQPVVYTTVEPYPISNAEAWMLNYCSLLGREDLAVQFAEMHRCNWDEPCPINPYFLLCKMQAPVQEIHLETAQHLVYYDAFAPVAQPELWTKEIFEKMISMLLPGGILVTYSSKGEVRRAMMAAGFEVEKLPGPPGKREMVRARSRVHGS